MGTFQQATPGVSENGALAGSLDACSFGFANGEEMRLIVSNSVANSGVQGSEVRLSEHPAAHG